MSVVAVMPPGFLAMSELGKSTLQIAVHTASPVRIEYEKLAIFGLERLRNVSPEAFRDPNQLSSVDVLVVEVTAGTHADDGLFRLTRQVVAAGIAVCLIVPEDVPAVREYLNAELADSFALATDSPASLAVAIFTAYNGAVVRRALRARVIELEQKLAQTKLINQAKSILAEQLNISEGAAIRRLRHQARNQRRSMVELAEIVIQAKQIFVQPGDKDSSTRSRAAQGLDGDGELDGASDDDLASGLK